MALAVLIALLALVASLLASANGVGGGPYYGTRVLLGDDDFVPSLMQADVGICRQDFGQAGTISDDTLYLVIQVPGTDGAPTTIAPNSVRLTPYGSRAPGTLVEEAAGAERATPTGCATKDETFLLRQDIDGNGRITEADNQFLCADANGTAAAAVAASAAAAATEWDACVRLQASGAKQTGTLVISGDSDLVNFGAGSLIGTDGDDIFAFFDMPASGTTWDGRDWGYFGVAAAGGTAFVSGSIRERPDLYSARIRHDTMSFGSRVLLGDMDFVPSLTQADVGICRQDFGQTGTLTDDGLYLVIQVAGMDGAPTAIEGNSVRLNSFGNKSAGTLVGEGNISESMAVFGQTDCATKDEVFLMRQDVDGDGRLTDSDHQFLCADTDGVPGGMVASSTAANITDWDVCVRLQASGNETVGTLVAAGDDDLVDFGPGTVIGTDGGDIFAFFDEDGSGQTWNEHDWGYFGAAPAGGTAFANASRTELPDLYGVRVKHETSPFGSRVSPGAPDYAPTLMQADVGVCRRDYGVAETITDDAFYLVVQVAGRDGAPNSVGAGSIRLNAYGSRAPGTLVASVHTAETNKQTDCATKDETQVRWQDFDGNGRLNDADNYFLCADTDGSMSGVAAASHTSATEWNACIRLQSLGPNRTGTLVTAGDADLVTFGTGADVIPGGDGDDYFGFFDSDASGPAFNDADWAYLDMTAVTGNDRGPSLHAIRLHRWAGDPPKPTPDAPDRKSTMANTTSRAGDDTSNTHGATPVTSPPDTIRTPAPSAVSVALLAGVVVASMAARRRT